jgi:hypothetical protein
MKFDENSKKFQTNLATSEFLPALAVKMNDWENHRTESAHDNAQIIKLVLFWFINSYLSLFYMAFYKQDLAGLRAQLASLLITSQLIWNAQEILTPYVKER